MTNNDSNTSTTTARTPGVSNLARTMARHRNGYDTALHANGKKTQHSKGDAVAIALLRVPFPALRAFGIASMGGSGYETLNDGHARMCLGNKLRARVRKGDSAAIAFLASFE